MRKKIILSLTAATMFCVMALPNAKAQNTNTEVTKQTEYTKETLEATATVKNIDYKSRKITLIDENARSFDIIAGDEVKNLNQIKKGDVVNTKYTEAILYNLNKSGKMADHKETATAESARPGEMPAANVERKVTTTVIISNIDRKEPSITIKSPTGETQKVKVKHPERLEGVKVGDAMDVTYSEALAIKVEKKNNR